MSEYISDRSLDEIMKIMWKEFDESVCPYVFYNSEKGFSINTVDAMSLIEVVLESCRKESNDDESRRAN